jgi:hypothetical protein
MLITIRGAEKHDLRAQVQLFAGTFLINLMKELLAVVLFYYYSNYVLLF